MKILILNLIPNTIGDTLFLTPLFRALKKNSHEVHVTVSPLNSMLLDKNQDIANLIVVENLREFANEKSKIKKIITYFNMILNLVKRCRKENYDACLVPQPNFFISQAIPFIIGAKKRIGYSYKGALFSFLLTEKIFFEEDVGKKSTRHYADTVLDLAKPLGIMPDNKDMLVTLSTDPKSEKKFLSELNSCKFSKYVCFQPGAKWLRKQWPKEHFKKLGRKLVKNGYNIVILGSEKEFELGEFIKDKNQKILNLCGKITIEEVAYILKNAKLNICNDSGLGHISSAVGAKTAVIYGISPPNHSEPLGTGKVIKIMNKKTIPNRIMGEDETEEGIRLMQQISVDKVFNMIKKVLV